MLVRPCRSPALPTLPASQPPHSHLHHPAFLFLEVANPLPTPDFTRSSSPRLSDVCPPVSSGFRSRASRGLLWPQAESSPDTATMTKGSTSMSLCFVSSKHFSVSGMIFFNNCQCVYCVSCTRTDLPHVRHLVCLTTKL